MFWWKNPLVLWRQFWLVSNEKQIGLSCWAALKRGHSEVKALEVSFWFLSMRLNFASLAAKWSFLLWHRPRFWHVWMLLIWRICHFPFRNLCSMVPSTSMYTMGSIILTRASRTSLSQLSLLIKSHLCKFFHWTDRNNISCMHIKFRFDVSRTSFDLIRNSLPPNDQLACSCLVVISISLPYVTALVKCGGMFLHIRQESAGIDTLPKFVRIPKTSWMS